MILPLSHRWRILEIFLDATPSAMARLFTLSAPSTPNLINFTFKNSEDGDDTCHIYIPGLEDTLNPSALRYLCLSGTELSTHQRSFVLPNLEILELTDPTTWLERTIDWSRVADLLRGCPQLCVLVIAISVACGPLVTEKDVLTKAGVFHDAFVYPRSRRLNMDEVAKVEAKMRAKGEAFFEDINDEEVFDVRSIASADSWETDMDILDYAREDDFETLIYYNALYDTCKMHWQEERIQNYPRAQRF